MAEPVNLYCICCDSEFNCIGSKGFILECSHFRCGNCKLYEKCCPIHQVSVDIEVKEEGFGEQGQPVCTRHNEAFECYCKNCEMLICYRCVFDHEGHEILEEAQLEELNAVVDNNFEKVIHEIWKKQSKASKVAKNLHRYLQELDEFEESTEALLENECQESLKAIDKHISKDCKLFYALNCEKIIKLNKQHSHILFLIDFLKILIENARIRADTIETLDTNLSVLQNRRIFEVPDLKLTINPLPEVRLLYYNSLTDDISLEEQRYFSKELLKHI